VLQEGFFMNFEEIGKKVKQIGKDTVEEVQKLNEVRQLNGKVNDTKKQIKNLYLEIGKKLYEQYKEAPFDGFESEIQAISEKYVEMEQLKDQVRKVKGVVLCPCCNMEVAKGERFCSNCGNKMPEVVDPEDADEDAVVVDAEVVEDAETDAEAETVEDAEVAAETEVADEGETDAETKTVEDAEVAAEAETVEDAETDAEAETVEDAEVAAETEVADEGEMDAEVESADEGETDAETKTVEDAEADAEADDAEVEGAPAEE
jgi:hypothetical protein